MACGRPGCLCTVAADLVTGPATNTTAAIDLVTTLTGVRGINIVDPASVETFREFLLAVLDVNGRS